MGATRLASGKCNVYTRNSLCPNARRETRLLKNARRETRLLKKCPTRDEAAEKCPDAGQGKLL